MLHQQQYHISPCITGDDKPGAIKLGSGRIKSSVSTCPVQVPAIKIHQLTLTGLLAKHSCSKLCTSSSKLLSEGFTLLVHRHAGTRKHQLIAEHHMSLPQLCSKEVRFIQLKCNTIAGNRLLSQDCTEKTRGLLEIEHLVYLQFQVSLNLFQPKQASILFALAFYSKAEAKNSNERLYKLSTEG